MESGNTLYYGDNLSILRAYVPTGSISVPYRGLLVSAVDIGNIGC